MIKLFRISAAADSHISSMRPVATVTPPSVTGFARSTSPVSLRETGEEKGS